MSLEYPRCDNEECYYQGREDRINGDDPTTFWINRDGYEGRFIYGRNHLEGELVLCTVCAANEARDPHDCALCGNVMIDDYIKLDNRHYCSDCLPRGEIGHDDYDEDTVDKWIRQTQKTECNALLKPVLLKMIDATIARRKEEAMESKKRKRHIREKNKAILEKWVPDFRLATEKEKKRVVKRLKSDEMPHFETAKAFIEYLIQIK